MRCEGYPYYEFARELAHRVKEGDKDAIHKAATLLWKKIPRGSVLVPIPSHYGVATYTMDLARELGELAHVPVVDALRCSPRDTLYGKKLQGRRPQDIDLGIYSSNDVVTSKILSRATNVILVDNVVDSGLTYKASMEKLREKYGVDSWMLSIGVVTSPKEDPYGVERILYKENKSRKMVRTLTEGQLKRIISESVKMVLMEMEDSESVDTESNIEQRMGVVHEKHSIRRDFVTRIPNETYIKYHGEFIRNPRNRIYFLSGYQDPSEKGFAYCYYDNVLRAVFTPERKMIKILGYAGKKLALFQGKWVEIK